jgi:hypothetical protein
MGRAPDRDVAAELERLDARIQALLPAQYQHGYADVSPTSMGSATLKFDFDGRVAWGEIWTTFCDLALAGGPPHRGTLFEPVDPSEVAAKPSCTSEVAAEIERAIGLTSGFTVRPGYAPGWLAVKCSSPAEAAWLQLAVTAENVSARRRGDLLQLPVGPAFRDVKEVKNVVVALAKASHYWDGHLTDAQQGLVDGAEVWEPASPFEAAVDPGTYAAAVDTLEAAIRRSGLEAAPRRYAGWAGAITADEDEAVWLLRAVLVAPVLARREEHVLYLPVTVGSDAVERAEQVGQALEHAVRLRRALLAARRDVWRPSSSPGAGPR